MSTIKKSIHDLSFQKLNSKEKIPLSQYKGKYLLLVNVASNCGFTPQYEGLQELQDQFKDQLQIIGFPCNQFLFQENGSESSIENFCQLNYGVNFPLSTKVKVIGLFKSEIFQWLTSKKLNGVGNYTVSWNFNKFLLDRDGALIEHYASTTTPEQLKEDFIIKGILK